MRNPYLYVTPIATWFKDHEYYLAMLSSRARRWGWGVVEGGREDMRC